MLSVAAPQKQPTLTVSQPQQYYQVPTANIPGAVASWSTTPPPAKSSGGGGGGGGSSVAYSAPAIDYNKIAQYDQEIGFLNAAINRLSGNLSSGNSEIDASWQNAINQLTGAKNLANTSYDQNKKSTADEFITAKNTIGFNAGTSLNGLQRLLGSRGAGGSTTARVLLPQAVARQATLQRNDASSTNAKNNQTLDQNWGQYLQDWQNQVNSANSQRDQKKGELSRSVEDKRAGLLQQIASLAGQRAATAGGSATAAAQSYLDQANAALDRATNYTVSPISFQTQAYKAPDLAQYLIDKGAAPTLQGQGPSNDYVSPYLSALLGKKQQPVGA